MEKSKTLRYEYRNKKNRHQTNDHIVEFNDMIKVGKEALKSIYPIC